jgi:exo-1,4-beta-D-glucosaminidase
MMRALLCAGLIGCSPSLPPSPGPGDGWAIQSTAKVAASGEAISRPSFAPDGFYPVRALPPTVVGALVDAGLFGDPFMGKNWRSIPGTDYQVGGSPAYTQMSPDSPFAVPWWFRGPLALPRDSAGKRIWLRFGGINDRASIYVDGVKIADESDVVGMYRAFEFDVTDLVDRNGENAVAVAVRAPTVESLSISFVDWAPAPADRDMGLWRPVTVIAAGPVRLRDPSARTDGVSRVTVSGELENAGDTPQTVVVDGAIEDVSFTQTVTLGAREKRTVTFDPNEFPQLTFSGARLWWPRPLGPQNLYSLALRASVGGVLSDEGTVSFGFRSVESELTPEGHRLFKINGHPFLVRGAGFTPDVMLRDSPERLEDQMRYVSEMGLNTIRLEGKVGFEELYDLADRYGVMLLAGWCCCEAWEFWDKWNDESRRVAAASLAEQARKLRNHPSALVWLNGSDVAPPPDVQQMYLDVLGALDWRQPVVGGASDADAPPLGRTGVKMSGPYLWVPPNYWYEDVLAGGAFGFNTETSPGPAIPVLDSLERFIPPDHRWPIDDVWEFHAGEGAMMAMLGWYDDALTARYGQSDGIADYARVSQLAAYEGERAMFEAYGRNKYRATGVIQWMLDNGWPGLYWHLYDYYLVAGGGYFGTKKALEPLHVQFSYDDRTVVVVNATLEAKGGLTADARLYDLAANARFSQTAALEVAADGVVGLFAIPDLTPSPDGVQLLVLELRDGSSVVSRNVYWLPDAKDVIAFDQTYWNVTAVSRYADLTPLRGLPPATVAAKAGRTSDGDDEVFTVTLENDGAAIAFFLRVFAVAGGHEIAPARWSDGGVTLLPGERATLTGRFRRSALDGKSPIVRVEGWNLAAVDVTQ